MFVCASGYMRSPYRRKDQHEALTPRRLAMIQMVLSV